MLLADGGQHQPFCPYGAADWQGTFLTKNTNYGIRKRLFATTANSWMGQPYIQKCL
jgi:hypothetical protein